MALSHYLFTTKGIKSSGYVVYFTAGFPYIVMTIFFIRGITLKGATEGLMHMFNPDVSIIHIQLGMHNFQKWHLTSKKYSGNPYGSPNSSVLLSLYMSWGN